MPNDTPSRKPDRARTRRTGTRRARARRLATRAGERVALVAGVRTPFARQATFFRDVNAVDLGRMAVAELLARSGVDPQAVDRVVFGQVIALPEAPNIAREIVLGTELEESTDAFSVSRACATSFQAAASIAEAIVSGAIDAGVAGGADSTSVVPVTVSRRLQAALLRMQKARTAGARVAALAGLRPRDLLPVPPAIRDYTTGLSMGEAAERMAQDHGIARADQDELAHRSHTLAARAWADGRLDGEVFTARVPPWREVLARDNVVRDDSDPERYASLRPVFDRRHGTVTAGNSSALTDGAAALLLMREKRARELDLEPIAYLRSVAFTANDARTDMLLGPSYATPVALDRAGLKLSDLDLVDMHEAFASQTLANLAMFRSRDFAREHLGRASPVGEVDMDRFNVLGGSIAYGHPFAATGARILTQTARELRRRGGGTALATACAAGGLGAALVLETA